MNDVLTLVKKIKRLENSVYVDSEIAREVFCKVVSIGQSEFYQSAAAGLKPELKFVLADFLDYGGEADVIYCNRPYSVIRTYRAGRTIELTCEAKVGAF